MRASTIVVVSVWMASGIAACAGDTVTPGTLSSPTSTPVVTAVANANPATVGPAAAAVGGGLAVTGSAGFTGAAPPAITPGAAGRAAPPPAIAMAGAAAQPVTPTARPPLAAAGTAATPAMLPPNMPMPMATDESGDPAKPIFVNPDMACRKTGGAGFGFNKANFKVDDRDVIIDYPCMKHEGAPVTFILNLHGTTPVEQHFYQEGYFSAWQFVESHNLIVATPSSVVQQWGNGDNGQDLPYLMNVIAYVYKAFGKLDIKSMWVSGHSWGAMYTSTFGCKPELADKVKGLVLSSGLPTLPACAAKMSVINTVAEMDIGPAIDFGALPMQHGCGAMMTAMITNNTETFWPNCQAPFVHAKYLMLGKMHASSMDKIVVQSIVDWIKIARQAQK